MRHKPHHAADATRCIVTDVTTAFAVVLVIVDDYDKAGEELS